MIDNTTMRTFVVHVENVPGVLNRVASLFRRRRYNIHSLNVSTTHEDGFSSMTLMCFADDDTAKHIQANLYKLVNVLRVDDITQLPSIERCLALIKVRTSSNERVEILQIADVFRARAVDVGPNSLTLEITGTQDKIDGLVLVLQPFGIVEMVQTGAVAMTRGAAVNTMTTRPEQAA